MEIFLLLIIALSLSIDSFTLSLAYGLLKLPKKTILFSSLSVGIFHFIMPLLGRILSKLITNEININTKYILLTMLSLIIIETIKNIKEENTVVNKINLIFFPIIVSLDSFSIGTGLNYITSSPILASTIFSITSFTLSYIGFTLGKYITKINEKKSKIISLIMLMLITIYIICK